MLEKWNEPEATAGVAATAGAAAASEVEATFE